MCLSDGMTWQWMSAQCGGGGWWCCRAITAAAEEECVRVPYQCHCICGRKGQDSHLQFARCLQQILFCGAALCMARNILGQLKLKRQGITLARWSVWDKMVVVADDDDGGNSLERWERVAFTCVNLQTFNYNFCAAVDPVHHSSTV